MVDVNKLDRKEKRRLLKEASDKIGRPFLFNRLMSGFLDLITIAILSVGFFLLFFMPSKDTKYDRYKEMIDEEWMNSGLYTKVDDKVSQLLITCDTAEDMIEVLEPAITNFYLTNSYAIEANKIDEYKQTKLSSGLFKEVEGNIVLITPYDSTEITNFYEVEYTNANDYLNSVGTTYALSSVIVLNILTDALFAVLLSSLIIYLLIPLLSKEGETLFQRVFKICLIDARDNSAVKKWQILVRYLAVTSIYLLLPIVMLRFEFGELCILPIAAGILLMCATKKSKGPQDYISSTQIILKHRSGVLETYNEIRK